MTTRETRPGPDERPADVGREGEARAADFLAERGYRIVARNVRADRVEIDLVAVRGRTVVFVEVKSRRGDRQGSPVLAVDARKQARLVRGARAWLHGQPRRYERVRFDVVACRLHGDRRGASRWEIEHWPGAFDAGP